MNFKNYKKVVSLLMALAVALSTVPFAAYASTSDYDLPYLELALPATETTTPASLYFAPLDDSMDITDRFICPSFLATVREITGIVYPNPILVSDVNGIQYLDLDDNIGITNFAGIEYFAVLKWLLSWYNPVIAIDISNNHLLEHLAILEGSLTTLNVSNNSLLLSIDVRGNQLTALDVSNNPLLTILTVADNQLTELDVSNNPLLVSFDIPNNQLTTLDVSNNPLLEWLSAFNNQLTVLDVSSNLAVSVINVHNNQLTVIDVSNNSLLEGLTIHNNQLNVLDVSNNPLLEWIWVDNNQLTSLDVSSNSNLTRLDVTRNLMTTPDDVIGWDNLFDYVGGFYPPYFFNFFPQRNEGQPSLLLGATIQTPATSSEATQNTITINAAVLATATGQTVEYAISQSGTTAPTTGWQAGLTFAGLTPNTEYFIWARSAANATHDAGTPMASAGISTSSPPPDNGNNNQPPPSPPPTPPSGGGTWTAGGGGGWSGGTGTTRTTSAPRATRITSIRVPVDGNTTLRATVSNNQANLNLAARTINQLTNNAVDNTVTFDFSETDNLNSVRLPRAGLAAFAEAGLAVEVRLALGTIVLSPNVVSSMLEQGNERFIVLNEALALPEATAKRSCG